MDVTGSERASHEGLRHGLTSTENGGAVGPGRERVVARVKTQKGEVGGRYDGPGSSY